jgi:hypothetical protein
VSGRTFGPSSGVRPEGVPAILTAPSRARIEIRDLTKTFAAGGRATRAVDGVSFDVLALGIHQVEARLLRWRPEYQARG